MSILPSLIGQSEPFLRAVRLIERIARYDAPVLIQGETGTGKEVAARAIHYRSARADAPFIPINCGALPDALVESELFGAERGAFTDARQNRAGLVEAAEGGTLFLDELDALPPRAQVSLLRYLQDQTFRPLGGVRERAGNTRIIAAASPRLPDLLASGSFRPDLAWRLNVLALELPPLRERPGDALLLAEHFVARHVRRYGLSPRRIHPGCVPWLERHGWPGNVRELDNLVHRALLLGDDDPLWLGPLAGGAGAGAGRVVGRFNEARADAIEQFERAYLEDLMRVAGGNVSRAARMAGKERRCLGRLLKKHGLDRTGSGETHPGLPLPTHAEPLPLRH